MEKTWFSRLTAILLRLTALGGIALLVLLLAAILVRAFAQSVLVDAMGMDEDHPIVSLLLKERKTNAEEEEILPSDGTLKTGIRRYHAAIDLLEGEIERAVGDYTLGRNYFTRLVNKTEHKLGYDLNTFDDEAILLQADFCFSLERALTDAQLVQTAETVQTFAASVETLGIPFLYVEVPNKVCMDVDWISGTLDHSEQNRIRRVDLLRSQGIDVLDLTDHIHEQGLTHREMFFPTDHHWTPETGLWAADQIAAYAEARYGLRFDRTVLQEDQYTVDVYEDVFLGSEGQKVTAEKIVPDDFPLYIPKYETDMDLYLQRSQGENPRIDARGDFLLQYDMYYLEIFAPILESDIYSTYLYANPNLIRIKNHRNPDGLRILMIGDSYDNVVIPFLAQASAETIALDCRFASAKKLHETFLHEGIDLVIATTEELERLLPPG